MRVIIDCYYCFKPLRVTDELIGMRVRCPHCKHAFTAEERVPVGVSSNGKAPNDACRVFLSHSARDHQIVRAKIGPLFRNYEIPFWWSGDNIPAGARWREEIQRRISECDWFVIALSPNAIASQPVREELIVALETKPEGRIIPLLLEECSLDQLHTDLPQIQYVDFTHGMRSALEPSYRKLVAHLLRAVDSENRSHREQLQRLTQANRRQALEIQKLTQSIDNVTGFDGNWTPSGFESESVPFVALADRAGPILAFANLKGGVGKTTLAANIGSTLWRRDTSDKVLLMDLDFQGSLSSQCLGRFDRNLQMRQGRTVSRLFSQEPLSIDTFLNCFQPIDDEVNGKHGGNIVAATEDLFRAELRAQADWLTGQSQEDARYHLRKCLHHPDVAGIQQWTLLDCPPRMTTATVNALACCDYLVIPVKLDDLSADAAPHMLQWMTRWRNTLTRHLSGVFVIANETHATLTEREKDVWDTLKSNCSDSWKGKLVFLETTIPEFREDVRSFRFPALRRAWARTIFSKLVDEMSKHVQVPQGAIA